MNGTVKTDKPKPTRLPRYRALAEKLLDDIRMGVLPVGERLPGELELQESHGVSRHTVREALRVLDDLGLIERRAGIGTVVVSRGAEPSFVQMVREPAELMRYPENSRLVVGNVEEITVDRGLAAVLKVPTGSQWARIRAVRTLEESGLPICWVDIYVRPEYADVARRIGRSRLPVYEIIAHDFGEVISRVEMDIRAGLVSEEAAALLKVEPGTPSLRLVRRYVGRNRRKFEVSVSEHPAERFNYTLEFRRGWQTDGRWKWG
ncbi:MAG: UTRA domain-containing protein [Xanthomonadales bacterium]|nr:UTRA domain-containing protein [Xanthomonadales bacterium]